MFKYKVNTLNIFFWTPLAWGKQEIKAREVLEVWTTPSPPAIVMLNTNFKILNENSLKSVKMCSILVHNRFVWNLCNRVTAQYLELIFKWGIEGLEMGE